MVQLTVEDILELHARGIKRWGGDGSLRSETVAAVGSVLYSATYNDGTIGYASGILCYLARAQHFMDGNKRAAWGGCVRALELNGFTLEVEDHVAARFVNDEVAVGGMDVAEIAERLSGWLEVLE